MNDVPIWFRDCPSEDGASDYHRNNIRSAGASISIIVQNGPKTMRGFSHGHGRILCLNSFTSWSASLSHQKEEERLVSIASQSQQYMRLQDCTSAPPEQYPLSVGLLTKTWRNTDPEPQGLREVRIQGTAEALSIECFGAGALVPLNSPAVLASPIFAANPGAREGMSFFVEFDFGSMVSRFQGNVNLGLLVFAGFHDFKDDSSRSNYFSREFFYSVLSLQALPSAADAPSQGAGSRHLDASSLLGLWRNTNHASLGI